MDFKTLFPILKKYLADGDGVPTFFRELLALITTVPEEEWGTTKDPSGKMSENTIRSYVKRGISQKLAKAIVYRLTPKTMTGRIKKLSKATRELFAADLRGYDPAITADNIGERVTALLVEIIQRTAGLVPQDALVQQRQRQLATDLRATYGDYLFRETGGYCPFPGCGKELVISSTGKAMRVYEVGLIDKAQEAVPENLLAMCPQCHATYLLDNNKKLMKELTDTKKMLEAHRKSVQLLDDLPLEKGIIGVIRKLGELGLEELEDASFDPKEIRQKLNKPEDTAIYFMVTGLVTTYFVRLRELMTNLDKRSEIDYETLQDQIHAMYKKLKKAKKSHMEIFNEIVGKIHRVTLQDEIYCQIVVSYFIQSCEVFDATT